MHYVRDERNCAGGLRAHALQTQQAREILGLLCLHGIEKSTHTRNINNCEREVLPLRQSEHPESLEFQFQRTRTEVIGHARHCIARGPRGAEDGQALSCEGAYSF